MKLAQRITAALLLFCACFMSAEAKQDIAIGVRAFTGEKQALEKWHATAHYLNEQLSDYNFHIVPVVSLDELTHRVSLNDFDFIITNPSSYVEMSVLHGATRILTLVNKREGKALSKFGSVIFTRANRDDVVDIKSLRNKTLMAVSEPAFGGWRVAWMEMKKQGFDPHKQLAQIKFVGGIQPDVVFGVRDGLADAGVVRTDMLERMMAQGLIDPKDFKVINKKTSSSFPFLLSTDLYPEWAFVKSAQTPDELSQLVAIELLGMKADDAAAIQGRYQGWTVPHDYSKVQTLLQVLKVGPYEGFGEITFKQAMTKNLPWIIGVSLIALTALLVAFYVSKVNRRLSKARLQLEKARDDLEQRVEKRTAELNHNLSYIDIIRRAQTQFISEDNPSNAFDSMLDGLLFMTGSEYGFVGDVLYQADGTPYLKTRAITNIAWNKETRAFYEETAPRGLEFFNLNTLFGSVLTSGKTVISNDPSSDERAAGIPEGHPALDAFLGVPMYVGDKMVGMAGVANRKSGYDEELLEQLQPFLVTCANMIMSHQNQMMTEKAQNDLKESQRMLQVVLDTIPVRVFWKGTDLNYLGCNRLFAEDAGLSSAQEIVGKSDFDLAWKLVADSYRDDDQKVINSGQPRLNYEEFQENEEGEVSWLETSKTPLTRHDGKLIGVLGTYQNITERKRSEQALEEERDRARIYLDTAQIMLLALDATGRVNLINRKGCELLGYEEHELVGKNWFETVLPKDEREEVSIAFSTVMAGIGEQFEDYENWLLTNSGEKRLFTFHNSCIRDDMGNVTGILSSAEDVTERRRAEQDIQSSETRLRSVINTIIDAVLTIDEKGLIETFNPAAEKMFGYEFEEVKGKNVKMLMPDKYSIEHDGYLHNYLSTGERQILGKGGREAEGMRKDGSIFPIELAVSEMWLGENRLFAGIVRDVTERKKVDKLKSEFVSTVSHELRTPLTSIRGSLGLMLGGVTGELNDKTRDMLGIASSNTERLLLLINDILDINKIESGQMSFKFQQLNVDQLLREALRDNEAYGEQHNVKFRIVDSVHNAYIYGDPDRLMQVLNNLLSNAAKFSPDGAMVELSSEHHKGKLRIVVKDNGPGIDEEFQSRLFDRFTQSDSTDTRKVGGTGLGLAISKAIIEKHSGHIGFESKKGEGSSFFFDLPVKLPKESRVEKDEFSQTDNAILVVEDEEDVATLICAMLCKEGYTCVVAENTSRARELLKEGKFLAATLDIHLPGENGIDFLKELRNEEKFKELPVIIVSVEADDTRSSLSGSSISVYDWINKPIDEKRLLEAVKRLGKPGISRVLHVEDDESIARVVDAMLEDAADIELVRTLADARQELKDSVYDMVLLDIGLPDGSGLELLDVIGKMENAPQVVIFSAHEVDERDMKHVSAALLKSRTDSFQLMTALKRALEIN